MVNERNDTPAAEEQRDLTLIALLVGVIIVAGGLFIFNSTSSNYTIAGYRAPPALNNVPIMTPASVPTANNAPVQ